VATKKTVILMHAGIHVLEITELLPA